MQIKIRDIIPGKYQPRAELSGLEELAESIRATGLINPIIVRKSNLAGKYELVCGARRLEASRLNKAANIEANVLDCTEDEARTTAYVDNIERADLSAFEQSDYIGRDLAKRLTTKQISAKTGYTENWIAKRIAVSNLPDDMRKLKAFASAPFPALMAVARLPEAQRTAFVKRLAKSASPCSVYDVKNFERSCGRSLADAEFDKSDCMSCTKCSLVQAELFADESDADSAAICYDYSCMAEKIQNNKIEKIKKVIKKEKCVLDFYLFREGLGKQFLSFSDWRLVDAGTEGAVEMFSVVCGDKEPVKRWFLDYATYDRMINEESNEQDEPEDEDASADEETSNPTAKKETRAKKKSVCERWVNCVEGLPAKDRFDNIHAVNALLTGNLMLEGICELLDGCEDNPDPEREGEAAFENMKELGKQLTDDQFAKLLRILGEEVPL